MVDKGIIYNDYKMGYISIKDIPYKDWNKDIISLALTKEASSYYEAMLNYTINGETEYTVDDCLAMIPKKYLNIRIYKILLDYDFIKYNKIVPRQYIESLKIPSNKLKNILDNFKYIPEINRTSSLYRELSKYNFDEYLMYVVNYYDIPDELRTREMCLSLFYSNIDKYVNEIPDSYKSIELCEMLVKMNFKKYFKIVPEECRTVAMYEQFVRINSYRNINSVPMNKRSQNMYNAYFDYTLNAGFDSIPFDSIPNKFRTKAMYHKLITMNTGEREKYIRIMPKEYFDEAIAIKIFEINVGYIKLIPDTVKNEQLYIKLLGKDINRFLPYIPEKYYTEEMIDKIVNIISNKEFDKKITTYTPIVDIIIGKYPELLSKFSNKIIKKMLEKELYDIINNHKHMQDIKSKYRITDETIKNVLKILKEENLYMYDRLNNIINTEKQDYFNKINKEIKILETIVLSLGNINRRNLNTETKLKIAYLIDKYITFSLEEIYDANDNKDFTEYSKVINDFIENALDYRTFTQIHNIKIKKYGIYYNNPWLKQFDINKYFDINNGKANSVYKYGKDEQELTLDIANDIISRLVIEEIPLNHLIVVLAFRNYFNNNLDEYIKELHSYDLEFKNIKRRKR